MTDLEYEVNSDIEICNDILNKKDIERAKKQEEILLGAYTDYIHGIRENLDLYKPTFGVGGRIDYLGDIEKLKRKLELFVANNCTPTKFFKDNSNSISINNSNNNKNTNSNVNDIDIELLFASAKKNIESDETLSEVEMNEIMQKINEIKEIFKTNESKNKKWFKMRSIMNWIGTKGVNIAINILPLINRILNKQ